MSQVNVRTLDRSHRAAADNIGAAARVAVGLTLLCAFWGTILFLALGTLQ